MWSWVYGYDILHAVGISRIATEEEIADFLRIFKSCWDGSVAEREKNGETLTILGLGPKHRAEECKRLCVEDYSFGPCPDHDGDPTKEWWVFGRVIRKREVYIKIRIYQMRNGAYYGRCLSFHIAEDEMKYPYKKKGA